MTVLQWLNYQRGVFAFKVNNVGIWDAAKGIHRKPSKFSVPGTHDIIGLIHGKFFSIEVKTPEGLRKFLNRPGKTELNQQAFMERVKKSGGASTAICSLDQTIAFIKKTELEILSHA